jgi:hypothetical protein
MQMLVNIYPSCDIAPTSPTVGLTHQWGRGRFAAAYFVVSMAIAGLRMNKEYYALHPLVNPMLTHFARLPIRQPHWRVRPCLKPSCSGRGWCEITSKECIKCRGRIAIPVTCDAARANLPMLYPRSLVPVLLCEMIRLFIIENTNTTTILKTKQNRLGLSASYENTSVGAQHTSHGQQ